MPPIELAKPVSASEQNPFRVDLGDWGPDGGVPFSVAIKVRVAQQLAIESQLVSAIQLIAHARSLDGASKGDGQNRFMMEFIDDICPPWRPIPIPVPPRPHWSEYVAKLGELGERYAANSMLSTVAFDLAQRTITRAQQRHNQAK